jgi:hypothetical protein
VSYSNNGNQAPFVVDLITKAVLSGSTSICLGDIIQVGVSVEGPFPEIILTAFNGTFDAQYVTNTNYNSDLQGLIMRAVESIKVT